MTANLSSKVNLPVEEPTGATLVVKPRVPVTRRRSFPRRIISSVCGERLYQRIRYGIEGFQVRRQVESITHHRLNRERCREAVQFWRGYGIRLNTSWHRFYAALNPDVDPRQFIPEDVFSAYIEPTLNRSDLALAYADKNTYGLRFPDARMPRVLLRCMHGRYLDEGYNSIRAADLPSLLESHPGNYVIKPALGTGGGMMVQRLRLFQREVVLGKQLMAWRDIARAYGQDFIVQGFQPQHEALASFHPASLNTLRVITLRLDEEVSICSCVLRTGSSGHCTDNVSAGGMGCGVQLSGVLREAALDRKMQRFTQHPDSQLSFGGFEIPGWYEACRLTKRLHQRLPYFDIASWDIAIAPDAQPCLIEVNLQYQEVNGPQCLNGPLFGPHTEAVLKKVFRPPA